MLNGVVFYLGFCIGLIVMGLAWLLVQYLAYREYQRGQRIMEEYENKKGVMRDNR